MVVYNGTYRGIVVDANDPAGMNRIRVQVPQVLGSTTSGWAYPAWSIHDMSIWPEDRFPKAGEGVWIRFESPDRMNWIGTFGLTEPAEKDPANAFVPHIIWTIPWLDKTQSVEIKGWVRSPSGTPNPDPFVILQENNTVADAEGNFVWNDVAEAPVILNLLRPNDEFDPQDPGGDGSFTILFKRTIDPIASNPNLKYRIKFPVTGGFQQVFSDIQKTVQPDKFLDLYWDTGDPTWATEKMIAGRVVPGVAGLPTPCRVDLQMRVQGTSPWSTVGGADVFPDKTWSIAHTRTNSAAIEYQAVFTGHSGYNTATAPLSPVPGPKQYAQITSTPTLTWDLPSKTILIGTPVAVTGTLNSTPYGVPSPPTVAFQAYVGTTWTTQVSAAVDSLGKWNCSYTPNANSVKYRMLFAGGGIWSPVTTAEVTRQTVFTTTTSVSTFPTTLTYGSSFTVSGTIIDSAGKAVTVGSVELWYRFTTGSDVTWKKATGAAAVTPSASGAYTLSHSSVTWVGPLEFKVKYLGDGGSFSASESSVYPRSIGIGSVTALTKGTAASTSASISWAAVAGVYQYNLYKNDVYLTSTTATSYTYTGLATNTTYGFTVLTDAVDAAGAGGTHIYGSMSPKVSMNTGKAAVTTAGSFTDHAVAAKDSDSHRDDVGWGYIGADVAQGYWSSSASRYCGVISYDTAAFKSWVVSTYGQAVWDNMNVTSGKITMIRHSSGGDNAANKIYWYHVNVVPGSSTTIDLYNVEETAGAAWNNTVVCSLPAAWIETVMRAGVSGTITSVKAVAIYKNAAGAAYQQYKGYTTSGACDMKVSASWSFTSAAAVAAAWL